MGEFSKNHRQEMIHIFFNFFGNSKKTFLFPGLLLRSLKPTLTNNPESEFALLLSAFFRRISAKECSTDLSFSNPPDKRNYDKNKDRKTRIRLIQQEIKDCMNRYPENETSDYYGASLSGRSEFCDAKTIAPENAEECMSRNSKYRPEYSSYHE